jgi:hypothetical protein
MNLRTILSTGFWACANACLDNREQGREIPPEQEKAFDR